MKNFKTRGPGPPSRGRRKAVSTSQEEWVSIRPLLPDRPIPMLVEPKVEGLKLANWAADNREYVEKLLWQHRALLFRDFDSGGIPGFEAFVDAVSSSDRLEYKDRSTPRNSFGDRIYNATTYPADQSINLHNEGSYWTKWAKKIFFGCATNAETGGETPIGDVHNVYNRIDPSIRSGFEELGVLYIRNFNHGFGLTWQEVYQTEDPSDVEAYGCRGARQCLDAVKPAYDAARAAGKAVGVGLGLKNSGLGNGFNEVARAVVRFESDGTVEVRHCWTEMGQGVHTVALQVAVEELGVDPASVRVIVDTSRELGAGQTTGSRGTLMGAGAVADACRNAIAGGRQPGVDYEGKYVVDWTNSLSEGVENPILHSTFGYAAQVVIADPETGVVERVVAAHDVGKAINPLLCEGQVEGAVQNALSVSGALGPLKLHAMADVFEDKLSRSHQTLSKKGNIADKIDVSPDRKFIGFDGYKNAMDTMKAGDIAILTTPCAFRWPMYEYAVEKGLNVFMEKPVTPDGFSSRKMLEINEKAKAKNLKVGVGLMCRHCKSRNELKKRIDDGAIGDINFLRSYRLQGPIGSCFTAPNTNTDMSELMYQIRNFHSFIWLSGGSFSDFFIHGIDEMCMIKGAFPVKAVGYGGRHYKQIEVGGKMVDAVDQNFDNYSVEYTFADGAKALYEGRNVKSCYQEFAAYAHGSKGSAVISTSGHVPARSRIFSDQKIEMNPRAKPENLVWGFPTGERGRSLEGSPYDHEWEALITAIREGDEHNEVERGVAASVTTSMGRMATHTGQEITYEEMLNCQHAMAPNVKELTLESDSPLMADADGRYPIPEPGIKKDSEY